MWLIYVVYLGSATLVPGVAYDTETLCVRHIQDVMAKWPDDYKDGRTRAVCVKK